MVRFCCHVGSYNLLNLLNVRHCPTFENTWDNLQVKLGMMFQDKINSLKAGEDIRGFRHHVDSVF